MKNKILSKMNAFKSGFEGQMMEEDPSYIGVEGKPHTAIIIEKLPGYFLIMCLVLVFLMLGYVVSPFITVIFLAAVLTIAFQPMYKFFLKRMPKWKRTASFLTCLMVVVLLVVPMAIFTVMLSLEAADVFDVVQHKVESGDLDKYFQWESGGYLYDIKEKIAPFVDLEEVDIQGAVLGSAHTVATFLVSQLVNIVKGITTIFINLIVMLFCMFYFFKDGASIVSRIGSISPLPLSYEKELFVKIKSMVNAVVFGVFATAIAQGIVGGLGFWFIGLPSPIFWATAIALFSLVPVVGTGIIWVPASIVLAFMGEWGKAIFMLIWGAGAIGSVDNVLRPYLIGGKAKTYPLMTFLVVLGGVLVMGLKGVIVGPLILILLLSFLHIYETEYHKVLKD